MPVIPHPVAYPDGTLEFAIADVLSGPGDHYGALHLNSTAVWVRWLPDHPWTRTTERSCYRATLVARRYGSAVEAWGAMAGESADHR